MAQIDRVEFRLQGLYKVEAWSDATARFHFADEASLSVFVERVNTFENLSCEQSIGVSRYTVLGSLIESNKYVNLTFTGSAEGTVLSLIECVAQNFLNADETTCSFQWEGVYQFEGLQRRAAATRQELQAMLVEEF